MSKAIGVGTVVTVDESQGIGRNVWTGTVTHNDANSPYITVDGKQVRKYEVQAVEAGNEPAARLAARILTQGIGTLPKEHIAVICQALAAQDEQLDARGLRSVEDAELSVRTKILRQAFTYIGVEAQGVPF